MPINIEVNEVFREAIVKQVMENLPPDFLQASCVKAVNKIIQESFDDFKFKGAIRDRIEALAEPFIVEHLARPEVIEKIHVAVDHSIEQFMGILDEQIRAMFDQWMTSRYGKSPTGRSKT